MNTLLKTIEVFGIIAFALTGIYEARKRGMDIIGVYSVGMVTAFGGGTLRDLFLDRRPLFWMEHYEYAVLVLVLSLLSLAVVEYAINSRRMRMVMQVADALGLGLFASSGASLANQFGFHAFVSLLFGVITGVFGGVIRDIICNEIPYVFQRTELYATCAFAGACTYLVAIAVVPDEFIAIMGCIAVTVAIRMAALRYKIRLPV